MNKFLEKIDSHRTVALLAASILIFIGVAFQSLIPVSSSSANDSQAAAAQSVLGNIVTALKGGTKVDLAATAPLTPLYKPVIDYEKAVVAAVKKASPAVVSIIISKDVPIIENCPVSPFSNLPPEFQQFFGGQLPQVYEPCATGGTRTQEVGGGSGFVISSDGLIVTNKHVISDASASYTVFTNDGKKYPATVLARNPIQDVAVLKIQAARLPTVELGNSDSVELGQSAIAIGNALGEFRNTVSVGVISGLARTVTASGGAITETIRNVLQTDAAINPGNSGGPLLNLNGQVIGINTAVASNAQNVGFAIPINQVKRDITSVQTTGKIEVPYLGVRYLMVTPELARERGLPISTGALIQSAGNLSAVSSGSPAAKAGIQEGDIIVSINGQRLDNDHQLGDVVSQLQVGQKVSVTVNRKGQVLNLSVTLERRSE